MRRLSSPLVILVLIILDLTFLFTINYPAVEINPYLLRDVQRALTILSGHFVLVGSDFTSGSYAPGPFYYLTIAPVLALFHTPFSVVAFSMLLKVAAQLVFSVKFSPITKVPAPIMYLAMSSSAFLLERFIWVNNSSFIAPFVQIFAVLLLLYWQSDEPKKRLGLLLLLALFAGGSIQTHFSLLPIALVALMVVRAKTRHTPYKNLEPFVFLVGFIATLTPFVLAFANDRYMHFFDGPVFFNSQIGAREFAKDGWRLFSRQWRVFHELNIFNLEVIVLFFYIALRTLWLAWKKPFRSFTLLDQIFFTAGILMMLFIAWILSGSYMRYFTVFFVPGLAYLTYDVFQFVTRTLKKEYLVFAAFFLAAAFVRIQFHHYPKNLGHQGKCEACVYQMERICDFFNSQEISFEQFSKSTYEIFPSTSHGSLYYTHHCFHKKTGMNPEKNRKYLFVDSDEVNNPDLFTKNLSRLPREVRPYYADPSRFKKEIETPGFTLFSVLPKDPVNPENRFSNLAFSYQFDPALGERLATKSLRQEGFTLFKASFCSIIVFCDLYLSAKLENQKIYLHLGSRLFQTKTELRPINAQVKNLKLEYLCDQNTQTIEVASVLGLIAEEQQNETLFTPLELVVPASCTQWLPQAVSMDSLELNANNSAIDTRKNERISLTPL